MVGVWRIGERYAMLQKTQSGGDCWRSHASVSKRLSFSRVENAGVVSTTGVTVTVTLLKWKRTSVNRALRNATWTQRVATQCLKNHVYDWSCAYVYVFLHMDMYILNFFIDPSPFSVCSSSTQVRWMMYWIVFALYTVAETIADLSVAW